MCVWDENRKKGLFIVFEGLDGAGKTTQARMLVDRLNNERYESVYLKEPTNGPWGQKIRQIAVYGRDGVSPEEELEFFVRDREEDSKQNIIPALESGKIVVMDRYIPSNMAYQGALGFAVTDIAEKNRGFPRPDIVFFLDIPPAAGLQRVDDRGGANVGFEKIEYLKEVHRIFNGPEFSFMERIDARGRVEAIGETVWLKVKEALLQRGMK